MNIWSHTTSVVVATIALSCLSAMGAEIGDYAEVTADQAEIKSGKKVLMTARKGDKFEIVDIQPPFYGVRLPASSDAKIGYLWNQQAKAVPAPLAPLYQPPAPEKYILVQKDKTPLKVGGKTNATVAKGRTLLVEREQPGWLWVKTSTAPDAPAGWVQDASVKRIDHHGPSLNGYWPRTIQSTRVSWREGLFVVSSDLPVPAGNGLTCLSDPAGDSKVTFSNGSVEVGLRGSDAITPGTRSLWVGEENGNAHRLDLPAPQISDSILLSRYDSTPDAQFVSVEVKTPAPGMWLEGCQIIPGRQRPRLEPLDTGSDADLAFADMYSFKGKTYVRLRVRDLSDDVTRWLYIRLHAPWGDRSDTIAIKREGDKIAASGSLFPYDQNRGPVDAAATVPDVELMPVELASEVLQSRGFKVEFVSSDNLQRIASPGSRSIVSRQGTPSGESMLIGETILLALGDRPVPESTARVVEGMVDVGGAFSLASLEPISVSKAGGEEGGLQWVTSLPGATGTLPVQQDAGVSLDPVRPKSNTAQAAFLKLLIASTLTSPAMPGAIGEAFRKLISADEQFQKQIKERQQLDIGEATEIVLGALKIELAEEGRTALKDAWSSFSRYRETVASYDLQNNGLVAEDVGIWLVEWLFENGHFNPADSYVPAADSQGNPVAILFQPGEAPAWSPDVQPPVVQPGYVSASALSILSALKSLRKHAPETVLPPKTDETRPEEQPPQGDPLKSSADGPTFVRIPNAIRDTVATADGKLQERGLRIANPGQLLESDRVTGSTPDPSLWVRSGGAIQLAAQRRVPDVTGFRPDGVEQKLRQWKFKSRNEGDALPTDVAVRQKPEAGEYASINDEVTVGYQVLTPDVTGKLVSEGLPYLTKHDLKYRTQTKMFQQDKIVEQRPLPGVLVEHGDSVDLVVHTRVPSVVGRQLSSAGRTLRNFDLVADIPNRLARDEDTVTGQNPTAGNYRPHGSTVRLSPVVTTVPRVTGYKLADAETILSRQNDINVRTIGNLIARDRITGQSPSAGTQIERGSTVTVDARVRVPDVRRNNIAAAARTIRGAGGELSAFVRGFSQNTDIVYSQDPGPGTLVAPRSNVSLVPGVFIPSVTGVSVAEARRRLANVNVNSRVTSSGTKETTDRRQVGQTVVNNQSLRGLYRRSNVNQVSLAVTQYVLAERTVPNVRGMAALAAIGAISRAELQTGTVHVKLPRLPARRMSVGEFRGFLLGQAIAAIIGGGDGEQPRIKSAIASGTQPAAGTRVMKGSRVDLYVDVTLTYDQSLAR